MIRSSFFEFHVAMTGVNTAQAGARVAAHNMANLTTEGFSRQVAHQRAATPMATNNRAGMVGTGSEVFGIGQIRNHHLDHRFWNESPVLGRQVTTQNQLTLLQARFGELRLTDDGERSGFAANFDLFFNALSDFHMEPSDPTRRNGFIQSINSMSRNVQAMAESFVRQQSDINREIGAMVASINTKAEQIAGLNRQIQRQEIMGSNANDLRDQRALLVDQMSRLANVTVTEQHVNGIDRFIVHINGHEIVSHDMVDNIRAVRRDVPLGPFDADGLYDIVFSSGRPFNMYSQSLSGELRGLIDVRDGNSMRNPAGQVIGPADFKGIPYYKERLNHLVQIMSNAFNFGEDRLGNPIVGVIGHTTVGTGIPLFVDDNNGTADINIFNFQINPLINEDHSLLMTHDGHELDESGANVLLGFMTIREYPSLFREGTVNDFITAVQAELGMDIKDATSFVESQSDVMMIIQNQRLSVKGVDMDEEMTNVIFFQHHFQAASRLITIINEIYDNMINRMGVR